MDVDNIGADEDMASRPRDDSMLGDEAKARNAPGADYVRALYSLYTTC